MKTLVFNMGSSSLKFQLFKAGAGGDLDSLVKGAVTSIGGDAQCSWLFEGRTFRESVGAADHGRATNCAFEVLGGVTASGEAVMEAIGAVGYRVVHGGDRFSTPALIDDAVLGAIESLAPLAPLHNPPALDVIKAGRTRLGTEIPMVAVFDTAFHHTLAEHVRTYALPESWRASHGIRRYGFHGLAHRFMFHRYLDIAGARMEPSKVITFQLGQGCSVTAIRDGKSVETSMGFTPMEGLIMATRPGDLDPGVVLHLARREGFDLAKLDRELNEESGLLGLSGIDDDMRVLLSREAAGHAGARLAVAAFCHRARKYLGAYAAVLGGAEAVIFGGGIGENSPAIRSRICAGMAWCGLVLDEVANGATVGREGRISSPDSKVSAYVIPVNEELMIARDTLEFLAHENLQPPAERSNDP